MLKKLTTISIILSCLFAAGCTPPVYRKPITMQNRQLIKSDDVVISTNQHTIVPINPDDDNLNPDPLIGIPENSGFVAAGAGGLIGGLVGGLILQGIDHHELTVATKKLTPVRKNLSNFDFMPIFENAVAINLQNNQWLKIKNKDLKYNIKKQDINSILNNPKYNTVLLVKTQYGLDRFFHVLMVNVFVVLDYYDQQSHTTHSLFKNRYEYFSSLDVKTTNRKQAIQVWDKNHDALLKSKLMKSAQLIGKMITLDINNPNANLYKKMNTPVIHYNSPFLGRQTGKVVAKINADWIVRTPDDTLHAFRAPNVLKKT